MTRFPPVFAFLHDLRGNNNHEWFAAHRPEYEKARALFEDFIQGLVFRIHNDMRFAKIKPPCKNHFSAVLAPGGRHSLLLAEDFADYILQVFSAMKQFFDYLQPLVGQQMRPARVLPKGKSEQVKGKERFRGERAGLEPGCKSAPLCRRGPICAL